ncbi:MAG TPA: prepilin peptidase [Candidatus Ratteibacteria bacterium]|nr:prepilin peptidase [Candidatus Ratteibacteria bacterium]
MGIIIFIFGLIFGSFANVCIYRLPKGKSIITPGSFCPNCKKSILWYDNIPLLSYIILKGKCRYCGEKISQRYFIVELLTGILFLLNYKVFGLTSSFFIYTLFIFSLIIISFIDIETFLISDVIVIPCIFLGLLFSSFFPMMHHFSGKLEGLLYSLEGLILGVGLLLFIAFAGKMAFKKDAMGGGDIKLLGMIGTFLGWKCVFLTLFFSSIFGVAISLILIGLKKKKIDDYIPFGPYLGLGAVISLFFKGHDFLGFFIN